MKNKLFILFIIFNYFLVFPYNIDLRINGIKDSEVYLTRYRANEKIIIDTAFIDKNGFGKFSKNTKLESGIYAFFFQNNKACEILISDDDEFSFTSDTSDLFFNLKINNAEESEAFTLHQQNIVKKQKLNSLLRQALSRMNKDDRRIDDIEKKIIELKTETENLNQLFLIENQGTFAAKVVNATMPVELPEFDVPVYYKNPDSLRWILSLNYFKNHYFDNTDLTDDRLLNTPILFGKMHSYFNKIIFQHPDSICKAIDYIFNTYSPGKEISRYIIGFVLTNYNQSDKLAFEDVLLHVYDNYFQNIKNVYADYKVINDVNFKIKFLQLTTIGKIAPDLKVKDMYNNDIELHSLKNNYVLLLFWNPDCPHCAKELELLHGFYEKYKSKDLEIFSICTDVDRDIWKKAVLSKKMNWINTIDPDNESKYREIYQVFYTPKMYLLDRNKTILTKTNDVSDLHKIMENMK